MLTTAPWRGRYRGWDVCQKGEEKDDARRSAYTLFLVRRSATGTSLGWRVRRRVRGGGLSRSGGGWGSHEGKAPGGGGSLRADRRRSQLEDE